MTTETPYRISGHESFPCRYTWLPKTVRGLGENPKLFSDQDQAMVDLGLGKNMVRAARFWAQATGMIASISRSGGHKPTDLGSAILGHHGCDPFLEDIRTLWLIHWKLSTNKQQPLLAWDYLLNRWHEPDLVHSAALNALVKEAARQEGSLSRVTIEQHLDTFLHTYVPTRGRKGEVMEDNLDSPLIELELLIKVGDRTGAQSEAIYAFRREEKPEITPELFLYCLNEFWHDRHSNDKTLAFREVAHGHGSPGQIFKLPEEDVRARVESLKHRPGGDIDYSDAANQQQLHRTHERDSEELLAAIYSGEEANA